jgi:hypothetical protein
MEALKEANRIRFARADLKRDLRCRRVTLAEAFDHPDVGSMRIFALLKAQWGWGDLRVRRVLKRAGEYPISESRMIESLTDREKRALLQACGENERSAA